ncbi:MAG: DUF5686 and carboxypeptidase regulatory-like domain-containing protein [Chitinophagaceae bacterium]|nr:DUF5686 and carboxypeptidase regulatory-like domain-containing protein [Chitinophagaceae bacterium]
MRFAVVLTALLFLCTFGFSQSKVISGYIKDSHSEEPIPFASVLLKTSGIGKLSDSSGHFSLRVDADKLDDSLLVTYVGYKNYSVALSKPKGDTLFVTVLLERGRMEKEVVVKSKKTRGWYLWRKVVAKKPFNDRYRFENFGYELYNKLEIDLNKFNSEKFKNIKLLRPFGFVIDQTIDSTSEDKPFLPVFLTETISDYYYQKTPVKRREEIKASRTSGLKNESVQKLLGGMDQNVNVYNNYIPVFDKRFVSPVSDNGDAFYNYRLTDTQYVGGKRFFHLVFAPKHQGENTFVGDCWVHDSTFAIQKMNLRLSEGANVNFVDKLSVIQEYKFINDSIWFLYKDKFVVDVSAIGKQKFGVTGRKTTTYQSIKINSGNVWEALMKNKKLEETVLLPGSSEHTETYWQKERHDTLSKNEKAIYAMVDTLQKMPLFKKYTNTITFLATGYKPIGNYEYGPWFNALSYDRIEGIRPRFDFGTSTAFSKKWWLRGYLAYGIRDQKFKGQFEVTHLFKKNPRERLYLSYLNDFDFGQIYYDEVGQDNIFSLAIRKRGVPFKFLKVEQQKIEYSKETNSGFTFGVMASHKQFTPVRALPNISYFQEPGSGETLNNTEVTFRVRFAYLERFIEGTFLRSSLGSPYPIAELKYSKGIAGVLNSKYNYNKISLSVSDYLKIGGLGEIYYNVYGGRVFGTLPFTMLEIHPGNEIYYYNKHAFNLMNRYEYISDRYAGINFEHNVGNGMFRLIKPTRKLKLRQFWTAKMLWGNLSEANKKLNYVGQYYDENTMKFDFVTGKGWFPFQTLGDKTYMELGTGVDNIFKVLRIDLIWRVLPNNAVSATKRFGVFGSFRLQF